MWHLPKEMYAEISRWLPNDYAGALMRTMAAEVIIKDINANCTYANGLFHSFDDMPAVISTGNVQHWYANGKRHRINGPAVIYSTGFQSWWLNGLRHRIGGPAVIYANNNTEYWVDGELHRVDGPAIIYASGHQEWYTNGKLHRVDGPAIVYANGTTEYWVNDVRTNDKK